MNGDVLASVNPRPMVRNHDKNRIRVEGFTARPFEKPAQGIIGIFDGIVSLLFRGVLRNAPEGVGIGLVVGDGEDSREKRPACGSQDTAFREAARVQILVAHSPTGGKSRRGKMFSLDESIIAVIQGEGPHSIKDSPAPVEKQCGVTVALQHARNRFDVMRELPHDNGVAGQWGERGKHAFEASNSAVSRSINVGEQHSRISGELVHFGSQSSELASQNAPKLRTETLLQQKYYI